MTNDQAKVWNGTSGRAWAEAQSVVGEMFRPFEDLLAKEAGGGRRVLDVGCGMGSTTIAMARTGAECVGVDISEPMLGLARARAGERVSFVNADAETYEFEAASFDRLVSRFGVMFFQDPVRAFRNLRRAATDDALLRMAVWRGPADNPFMTTAERAAAPLVSGFPERVPDAPGQFGFANAGRVQGILEQSGWRDVVLRPVDVACSFAEMDLELYFTRLGPLGGIVAEFDEELRKRVIRTVREAFAPYVEGGRVRFNAACWMLEARA